MFNTYLVNIWSTLLQLHIGKYKFVSRLHFNTGLRMLVNIHCATFLLQPAQLEYRDQDLNKVGS